MKTPELLPRIIQILSEKYPIYNWKRILKRSTPNVCDNPFDNQELLLESLLEDGTKHLLITLNKIENRFYISNAAYNEEKPLYTFTIGEYKFDFLIYTGIYTF